MKLAKTAAAETVNMMDVKVQYRGQKSYKTTSGKGISLLSRNDKLLLKKTECKDHHRLREVQIRFSLL